MSEQNASESVRTALRTIVFKQYACARVSRAVRHNCAREFPGIAQAEIEALSGDRMQCLCRIANMYTFCTIIFGCNFISIIIF